MRVGLYESAIAFSFVISRKSVALQLSTTVSALSGHASGSLSRQLSGEEQTLTAAPLGDDPAIKFDKRKMKETGAGKVPLGPARRRPNAAIVLSRECHKRCVSSLCA